MTKEVIEIEDNDDEACEIINNFVCLIDIAKNLIKDERVIGKNARVLISNQNSIIID